MWNLFKKRYTEQQMQDALDEAIDDLLERRWGNSWTYGGNERDWETGDIFYDTRKNSPQSVLQYAPVVQAVSLISGDIAKKQVMITQDDPQRVQSPEPWMEHTASYLVCKEPRPGVTAFQFWRRVMLNALIGNSGYAIITRNGSGRPIQLWEIPYWWVYWNTTTEMYEVTVNGPGGIIQERFNVPQENMLHIEGLCYSDYWRELCVTIYNLGPSWGLGKAAEDFLRVFFERGAQQSGVVTVPAAMKKAAREKVEEGIVKKYGGLRNAFKIMVLRDGAKFESTQVAPVDAEISNVRNAQVADVARSFNLPPHKLGLPMNVSYSSLIEEEKAYTYSTLGPWLTEIQSEIWCKLLTERQKRSGGVFVTHQDKVVTTTPPAKQVMAEATVSEQPRPSVEESQTDESPNGNDNGVRSRFLQRNGAN